jgi:HK97 family phage major capsid protein
MPNLAEMEQELTKTKNELEDAKKLLEAKKLEDFKTAEARKLADAVIAKKREERDTHDKDIFAEAQRLVAAELGPVLYSALADFKIGGDVIFPGMQREGNLSKTNHQMLNIILGRKAMDTVTSYAGTEWVPTELGNELIGMVEMENLLRSFIRTVDMPTDTYELPMLTSRGTVYYKGENSAPTASNPATNKLTLTAKKFIGLYELSYELEENRVIPIIDILKEDMAKQIANAEERAILWGDTVGTAANNIDKTVTAGNPQLAFNGLWKTCKGGTATWYVQYATDWPTSIRALRAAMDKYAISPKDLLLICPVYVMNKLRADTNFQTWDKVGPNASALTGMLPNAAISGANMYGFFDGIPAVCSPYVYKTDANGIKLSTAGSNTKYGALLVNRNRVILGQRRALTTEMDVNIAAQTRQLVLAERVDLGLPDGGTTGAYAASYNGS